MKSLSVLFFLLIISISFKAQILHCGADEMRIETLKKNQTIAKAVERKNQELEAFTQNYILNPTQQKNTATATYIIPVVFHVIHNYGNENIADAQIKDGLDWVNKTFRKQRPDTASMVADFKPIHADCDIEFRLATKDPNGNCHSGINRIASALTTSGDHRVKNLVHWPPTKYLNVYIVANAAGLAGHCVWPSDADTIPLWDGIVIGHNYVGTFGTSNLTQSVAFAHECGHFLNLHHIWGGNNVPGFYYYPCADPTKDCNIDDLVADTPPTIGWQSCNLSGASCGNTVDNVQNVMDYSYCNVMFTQGQKARMHACLNSTIAGRNNLWQPANLLATGVSVTPTLCAATFMNNKSMICPGNQVIFTNTSFHGPFSATSWTFTGGTPSVSSVANPTITYNTPGVYNVTLMVKNGADSITIIKPNCITVQTTTNSTVSYPFFESFETIGGLTGNDWFRNNLDTSSTWQLTNLAAATGSTSVMIDNFNSGINGKDELYCKPLNLTGAATLNISFKYAYARRDSSNNDQLQLFLTPSCNGTMISRFLASGSALETVPPKSSAFFPANSSEWKMASASVPSILFTNGARLKFVFSGNGGNNIFIDDINIDVNAGIFDINDQIIHYEVFPNPAENQCSLRFSLNIPKTLFIKVYNMLGQELFKTEKTLFNEGENELSINTEGFTGGVYMLSLTDGYNSIHRSLIIAK